MPFEKSLSPNEANKITELLDNEKTIVSEIKSGKFNKNKAKVLCETLIKARRNKDDNIYDQRVADFLQNIVKANTDGSIYFELLPALGFYKKPDIYNKNANDIIFFYSTGISLWYNTTMKCL